MGRENIVVKVYLMSRVCFFLILVVGLGSWVWVGCGGRGNMIMGKLFSRRKGIIFGGEGGRGRYVGYVREGIVIEVGGR
jgi:hypothetical protein